MPKKVDREKKVPTIKELRRKLPSSYREDLMKLLPDMGLKQIEYVLSGKCKDFDKNVKVHTALTKLAQVEQKKQAKLSALRG